MGDVILNLEQMTRTTFEVTPPLQTTTPYNRRNSTDGMSLGSQRLFSNTRAQTRRPRVRDPNHYATPLIFK
ncbi:hypothetical protein TNCV_2280941 [Trichonephila clavipes]|nr:hypothetical protein TNCV_2280941 [Trichonephila clavipes]